VVVLAVVVGVSTSTSGRGTTYAVDSYGTGTVPYSRTGTAVPYGCTVVPVSTSKAVPVPVQLYSCTAVVGTAVYLLQVDLLQYRTVRYRSL
jgi:hypothetical protein